MPKHYENMVRDLPERFWSKVDRRKSCWLWLGSLNELGYGKFSYFGRSERAHRVAYILTHGDLPAGACVLHNCDNPKCVNPAHLRAGTKGDNARDRVERNRVPKGEAASWSKLTVAQVRAIRKDQRKNIAIAADYGVSRQTIYSIKSRHNWKHV